MKYRYIVIAVMLMSGIIAIPNTANALVRMNPFRGDNCAGTNDPALSPMPFCLPVGETGVKDYGDAEYAVLIFAASLILGSDTYRVHVNQWIENCEMHRYTDDSLIIMEQLPTPHIVALVRIITLQSMEDMCFSGCI